MEVIKINELESILENISAKKIFSNNIIEIIEISLLAGEYIPKHKNDVTALFNIIEGKGSVIIENKKYCVEKGDFLRIEKDLDRELKNTGHSPLKIVVTKLMN